MGVLFCFISSTDNNVVLTVRDIYSDYKSETNLFVEQWVVLSDYWILQFLDFILFIDWYIDVVSFSLTGQRNRAFKNVLIATR